MFPFEERDLFFANGFLVAKVLHFDAVNLRHQRNHLNTVLLTPEGDWKQDNLRYRSKEQDCKPPVTSEGVAWLHQVAESSGEEV